MVNDKFVTVNIRKFFTEERSNELKRILSEYTCPVNHDVDKFLLKMQ